jgi:outer membrane protein assembly factor BamB
MRRRTALITCIVPSLVLIARFAGVCATASGQETTSAPTRVAPSAGAAELGSAAFHPTPERPIGWRGDWTGRFPGATPPIEWSRRLKGITAEIAYQADRPSGTPGAKSRPLEYFTIKEWLVAGPFPAANPEKDIEKDFLGGEADVQPAAGDKAGAATWKHLRVGIDTQSCHYHNEGTCGDLNVDFVYVFGNLPESGPVKTLPVPLNNKVAYGHTYFHAPTGGAVMLRVNYAAAALKVWLNGRAVPLRRGEAARVSLEKGWNRLLVKAASGEAAAPEGQNPWVSRWRFAAYLEPVPPFSYQTRNIAWMTKMTGRSMSAPIVVGDRVFIGSGMTDLVCLDKKTGKILWLRSNTPYDAMTSAQRAEVPEINDKIAPLAAELDAQNRAAVAAINAAVSPAGLASEQQAELDKVLKAKADAERAVHDALARIDRRKYPQMYRNEVSSSNAVPLSDGRYVYWVAGGGMKGPGSHLVACFDLDGKRLWSWHDGGSLGAPEHGNHESLNMVGGRVLYGATGTLVALDAKTGKELWRNCPDDWQNIGHGSNSPLVLKAGDEDAILHIRYLHRVSDGTVICPSNLDVWGVLTPIVQDGVIYNPCRWHGFNAPVSFVGVKPPASAADGAKTTTVLDLDGKDVTMPVRAEGPIFMVASPLWVDGVVYSVEMGGGLTAVDTVARKALYRQFLDGYNRYNRFVYGVAASPALGGKNIYITDDAGYTHVLRPGPRLDERARNVIENIHLPGLGGNPCKQESFYSSPYFDGKRMYLRGEEYLYCIGTE